MRSAGGPGGAAPPMNMLGVALRDSGLRLRDLTALARAADDAGYESIWAPEVGSRDAILLSALYGSATKHATVGTGVIPIYARNIAALSLSAAAAAEASDGRFILGLGAGHRFPTEAWYEAKWYKPRARLREMIDLLRRIFAGERVSHNGSINLAGFHLGSDPPAIPIYIAGLTPATLRLAGEVADGVILNWLPPDGIEKAALVVREAAADAGRRVRIVAYVRTAIVDDPGMEHTVREALHEQTYSYLSLPAYANSLRQVGFGRELDAMASGGEKAIDSLTDTLCAWGDAATVGSTLDTYAHAGLDSVIVYPVPYGDDPAESVLQTIRAANPA
jgi:alkanesulfonate monooxygenase SsuD/methylene tetrahydromethanopterin reductase-like flavin-dependent oxidoreductase (luciferase family)